MTVYENLTKYFNRYIKNYLPYKGNKVFQSISSVLLNHFLKESYVNIPYNLAYLVENQKITSDLYDKLLIGNGYPSDIIKSMTLKEKRILLNYMMHYQNDQGDLYHFIQIASLFDDKFNIYELFGDYRILNENNIERLDYVMAGRPIYKYNDEPDPIYDYDEIYNATPTYFLSRQQLDYWRLTKSLVLPFKTNLLSLEWQNVTNFNYIDSIVAVNVYSYFQRQKFQTVINNRLYTLNVGDIYMLYYYITFYVDGYTFQPNTIIQNINFDIRPLPVFPLDPTRSNSLDSFIEASQSIKDGNDFYDFYHNRISNNYNTYLTGNMLSLKEIRLKLLTKLDIELISYLEMLIDTGVDKLTGLYNAVNVLETVLDEFIETSPDPNAKKYEKWLKLILSKPNIDPRKTPTYKLMYQFKPYHTQFILRAKFILRYTNDYCWIRDDVFYVNHHYYHSAEVISDYYLLKIYKHGTFCLTQNENYLKDDCKKLAGIKIGDMAQFVQSTDDPQVDCGLRQVIDVQKENVDLSTEQHDSIINLFNDNTYKQNELEKIFSSLVNNTDDEFLSELNKVNDINLIKYRQEIDPIMDRFFDLSLNDYNNDIEISYKKITDDIDSTTIPPSGKYYFIQNLSFTKYTIIQKTDIENAIKSFKYQITNTIKDILIKLHSQQTYTKDSIEYLDVNASDNIINQSDLFDDIKFEFNKFKVLSTFPINGDTTIKPFLNYINLNLNKFAKLGSGTISLIEEENYNISINKTKTTVSFTFNKPVFKNSGKLILQPKQNYIISPQFDKTTSHLELSFNKQIQTNNGNIYLIPEILYTPKNDILTEFSDFISNSNIFLTCLDVTYSSMETIDTDYIIFDKFYYELNEKIKNYEPTSKHLSNLLQAWNKYYNLNNSNNKEYDVVNYDQFKKAYDIAKEKIIFTQDELDDIKDIIGDNDKCTVIFDRPWTCETKCYDTVILTDLPPVLEILTDKRALYTFNTVESAKYVHANDIGFTQIYIGDYIWVYEDGQQYAVKVIGKDLNALNLKIEKYYRGTAGTFNKIGRYRSGF